MAIKIFDVNPMLADLSQFDAAASASAINMKANFDAQIAGIADLVEACICFYRASGILANVSHRKPIA
jgi:hypothetical protein